MKTYVYLAGPINSSGVQNRNVRRACEVAEEIRRAGLVPFVPHLNVLWDTIVPTVSEDEWLEWDFAWLAKCDALYRLKGYSRGSDREVLQEDGDPELLREREQDGALTRLVLWADRRENPVSVSR